jgi:hypothetical protein
MPPCNGPGSLPNLQCLIDISPLKPCYLLNSVKNSLFFAGDQFARDCAHHQSSFANRTVPASCRMSPQKRGLSRFADVSNSVSTGC